MFTVAAMAAALSVSDGCAQNNVTTDQEQPASGVTETTSSTLLRDTDFFGVNVGPYDLFHQSASWPVDAPSLSSFTYEARVKITETSAASATAGIFFLGDGERGGFYFNIFPHQDYWRLYDNASKSTVARGYEADAFGLDIWYTLKAEVTEDRLHIFIDGVRKTPPEGVPRTPGAGIAGLRVRNASACFDDVKLTIPGNDIPVYYEDFSAGEPGWKKGDNDVWSAVSDDDSYYTGNAIPGRDRLMSPEQSPAMNTHFDLIQASGAGSVRAFFPWDDVQIQGPNDFYWDYLDSMVIAARNHGLKIVPVLVDVPSWAVAPANRGDEAVYAFPPQNNEDYARFVAATVSRYKPGGALAQAEGWQDGYGITTFEIGHEFNVGKIMVDDKRMFFAGWLGNLDQYVDLLKAGHDAVKQECAECKVLNGAAGDDVPVAYNTPRTDPGGLRQTVWQGVEDLYENIQARHPDDPQAADRYFDILNIHSYEWFMLSGQGQYPDFYRSYAFPDRQWYRDRLTLVTGVMSRYGDGDKDLWLTETSYASDNNGDSFAGYLSEQKQAEALRAVYEEASAYPQVKTVFWWYAYDINYKVGLIRADMSVKPSYDEYARLAGRQ